jgi:sulfatase modifying factor 1
MNWFCRLATVAVAASACSGFTLPSAHAVTIDWVTVGDPGNAADTNGVGAVAATYQIMKFEFTNAQYVDFLNAVDPAGSNPNSVYNSLMTSNVRGGINFTAGAASGSKYSVKTNMGDKPVNYINWFDAARVANWFENGQGSGSTETGAYTLSNATSGNVPGVNAGAQFFLPTEDQWYKAAYYKGGGTNAGYWDYATQSDTLPAKVTAGSTGNGSAGSTGNFANYDTGAQWNGQNGNVTTVGTNGTSTIYGAFDMTGNVWEWNDLAGFTGTTNRQVRGGNWANPASDMLSSRQITFAATTEDVSVGFRLAAVPEPSTYIMALAGLACGGYSMWRRRKHTS